MRLLSICAINATLLCGCMSISTKPPGDLGFSQVPTVASLSGCYQNRGEVAKNSEASPFLSSAIWQNANLDHASIETVQVRSPAVGTLHVSAINSQQIVHEETFVEGKDFSFQSGQITFSRIKGAVDVFIGVLTQTITLGVDAQGDGRQLDSVTMVGTVFLIFPVGASSEDVARFKKLECGGHSLYQ